MQHWKSISHNQSNETMAVKKLLNKPKWRAETTDNSTAHGGFYLSARSSARLDQSSSIN